jgi:copper transport protein
VVAGISLALIAVILSCPAASAHAVLLGSDPPVGAVVPTGPPAVRLHFSEPVETSFSGIQLTAPDGQHVQSGPLQAAGGGRDLVLPLPALNPGSYTVNWEVLASDGHPDSGHFRFSVGAPSGTSPGALLPVTAGNPDLGLVFGQVRFAWFAAFMFILGAAVVRRFVWDPAVRAAEATGSVADTRFQRRFAAALPVAWVILALSGAVSLLLESATVSGRSWWSSLHPAVLAKLLGTAYGRLWLAQMVLTVALALPVVALSRRPRLAGLKPRRWLIRGALVVGALGAVAALNGHARTAEHPTLAVAFMVAHLLAAAVWAGGLTSLVVLGAPAWRARPDTRDARQLRTALVQEVLPRFSRLAVVSTSLLVVTGVLSARQNLGAVGNLWRVAYGRMVMIKLVLLAIAIAFGARHLLVLPRRLAGSGRRDAVMSFERSSRAEVLVLACAVAVAAALAGTIPARYATVAATHPVDLKHQIGNDYVELVVAPTDEGVNQLLLSFVGNDGVLVAHGNGATATIRQPNGVIRRVELKALSSGAFIAPVSLPAAGAYRVAVTDSAGNSTTFSFNLPKPLRA